VLQKEVAAGTVTLGRGRITVLNQRV
ncbi:MAG: hypothetical protein QOG64_3210, partial [Acidimicrobiaceae bacterium]|nr:hypothetical protein [Acidimicrobiaceae bacterium]